MNRIYVTLMICICAFGNSYASPSEKQKQINEYRQFMNRQYKLCLLQVSIYKKESELNEGAADLGKLYKRAALLRSEECALMKQSIREFDDYMKHRRDRQRTIPKMTNQLFQRFPLLQQQNFQGA